MALSKEARKAREKAKLRTVKDKLEDKKGLLTNEEVFTSYQVKKYLQDKTKTVLTAMGLPNMPVTILWDTKEDAMIAGTDNCRIVVNAGSKLINTGDRTEIFRKLCGVLAHEIGHILFTNFTENESYIRHLADGKIYPTFPRLEAKYKDNARALLDFLEGKRGLTDEADPKAANRTALCNIVSSISNILEDGREEALFTQYCSRYRTLYEGLVASEKAQKEVCAPLSDLLEKVKTEEKMEFEVLMQIMLHYARFGEISGYNHKLHKAEPIVQKFREITCYCDDYLDGYSSVETLTALNRIVIILFPEIEEYILAIDKKLKEEKEKLKELAKELLDRLNSLDGNSPANPAGSPSPSTEGTDSVVFKTAHPEKFGLDKVKGSPGETPEDATELDLDELFKDDEYEKPENDSEEDDSEDNTESEESGSAESEGGSGTSDRSGTPGSEETEEDTSGKGSGKPKKGKDASGGSEDADEDADDASGESSTSGNEDSDGTSGETDEDSNGDAITEDEDDSEGEISASGGEPDDDSVDGDSENGDETPHGGSGSGSDEEVAEDEEGTSSGGGDSTDDDSDEDDPEDDDEMPNGGSGSGSDEEDAENEEGASGSSDSTDGDPDDEEAEEEGTSLGSGDNADDDPDDDASGICEEEEVNKAYNDLLKALNLHGKTEMSGDGKMPYRPSEIDREFEELPERPSRLKDDLTKDFRPTEKDFREIENELVTEKGDELTLREEEADLNELMDLIDFSEIHANCVPHIHRPEVMDEGREVYNAIAPELQKIADRLVRNTDFFIEEEPTEVVGCYSGKKFHAERVAKADYKYFGNTFPVDPVPRVNIMISVDMSGSMCGRNINAAMQACLLMYLYAKNLPTVDLAIIGDTESWGYNEDLYVFKTFGSDLDTDKYRICAMPDHGMCCNRDGYALRYCKELLAEQDGDNKLLIRISDGLPAATGYGSTEAELDIKDVCRQCEREDIAYIAAAIDANKEEIKHYYGEKHFLDITDLSKLPVTLSNLLRKMFQ